MRGWGPKIRGTLDKFYRRTGILNRKEEGLKIQGGGVSVILLEMRGRVLNYPTPSDKPHAPYPHFSNKAISSTPQFPYPPGKSRSSGNNNPSFIV
eukprot:755772-Hanusia_phi.AAC.8